MIITAENAGRRLDKFLFGYLNEAPHSFVYKMLRKKRIKLNGNRAQGSETLSEGDELKFYLSPETIASFQSERFTKKTAPLTGIIYEDANLLVVNKPPGLPSHGGMDKKDHLLARVEYYLKDHPYIPALCNRLDVNTSGLVVCGKNPRALKETNALFATQGLQKEYLAVVQGIVGNPGDKKILQNFYEKDTTINKAKIIQSGEVQIKTAYTVIATSKTHTLLRVSPITGKSHQIRVHLASIGHPLAGDKKYGGKPAQYAPGQLLHCHKITTPTHSWEAPLPTEIIQGLAECGLSKV